MARGFNKVILMGNLARDPEIRYTQDKKAWARFTVACGRTVKKGDKWEEVADFIPVVVWGPQAENAEKYLHKGKKVHIEGMIQTRTYEKDDEKRWVTEVLARNVLYLGGEEKKQENKFPDELNEYDGKSRFDGDEDEEDADVPF